jgi:PAS domain S-box-containing protein
MIKGMLGFAVIFLVVCLVLCAKDLYQTGQAGAVDVSAFITLFWLALFMVALILSGLAVWILKLTREIRHSKEAEAALRLSEERFRTFFDNAPIGKTMTAPDGRLQRVNNALCKLLGYTAEELSDLTFETITHPDDLARTQVCVRSLLDGKQDTWPMKKRYVAKDGHIVWAQVNISLQRDTKGRPLYFLTHIQDISERKSAEAALQKASTELQLIFKNMINAFVVWESVFDENGRYISFRFGNFNDAYARIAGVRLEDVRGKDVFEIWPGTESSWVDVYGDVAVTGNSKTFDMYHDPTKGWYHCNAYRPTDSPTEVCAIFEDITERKLSEEVLRKTQSLLNETQKITKVGGWEYDVQTHRITWTEEVYNIYGVEKDYDPSSPEQDIQFYAPEDRNLISEAFQRAVEKAEPYDLEVQMIKAQGTRIWVRTMGQVERKGSEIVRVFGNIMDITGSKRAEEKVHALKDDLERRVEERTSELREAVAHLEELNRVFVGRELKMAELKERIAELERQRS